MIKQWRPYTFKDSRYSSRDWQRNPMRTPLEKGSATVPFPLACCRPQAPGHDDHDMESGSTSRAGSIPFG